MVNAESLARVIDIAREAGAAAMAHYGALASVQLKADQSPVTAADHAAHHVIVQALHATWPDVPIISEEGEIASFDTRQSWTQFWLVDPLDGTKEFVSQNGEFTVNIALIEDGVPTLGVVFAPALDVLYSAGRGLGSWMLTGDAAPVRLLGPKAPTADGIIDKAERSGGYGNMVEINHGKGIQTRYGHLSKILVAPYARVKRGQLIALMGSTGRSTGSHLHYEVRIDGNAVNPVPFLQTADYLLAVQDRALKVTPAAVGGPAD